MEAALDFARYSLLKQPPQPPPPGLKRYLGFSKLSPAAVRAIAKIIDSDEDFRTQVAEGVDKDELGRGGWLWLTRPEGWEDELQVLEAEAAAEASAAAEERSERNARRKLGAAREAAERANATAEKRAAEAKRLREDLAHERSRRSDAERRAKNLSDRLEQLQQKQDQLARDFEALTEDLAARTAEAQQAQERVRELEASLAVQESQEPEDQAATPEPQEEQEPHHQPDDEEEPQQPQPVGWDREDVVAAVASAAAGASMLGDALARLGSLLDADGELAGSPGDGPREASGPVRAVPDPNGRTSKGKEPSRRLRPHKPSRPRRGHPAAEPGPVGLPPVVPLARRLPIRLPGGVMDDSVEAADHLLRTQNVLVLIDGYNVTMVGWPELRVADQRARLLKALDSVAASSGAEIEVIFDGAEVDPVSKWPTGPRDVRVRFSPPDVEADDVVLDMLAQLPPARPVVVVSSDNRVRAGAWELGANLLHAHQLLELLH